MDIGDYFFLLRPTLWFPIWTILLCGANGRSLMGGDTLKTVFVLISSFCLIGAVYLANQLKDVSGDKLNDKLHYLALGIISTKNAKIYLKILIAVGVLFLLLTFQWLLWIMVAVVVLFTGLIYNIGKKALKNSPWGSLTATFFGGLGSYLVGSLLATPLPFFNWVLAYGYAFAFTATGIMTMIPDIEGDKAVNKMTIAVKYGALNSTRIATGLVVAALLVAVLENNMILLLASTASLPFFINAARDGDRNKVLGATKISIFALSVSIGIFGYPVYLAIMLIYYIVARGYYKKRFGLDYPSLAFRD
ncbi:UbiA family prenyltransferase [bacterium]|nr:UbiA family prenyltransferase [bacterium]